MSLQIPCSNNKIWFTIDENALVSTAKNVLLQLGVKAATLASDAAIQNKIKGSGMTGLIISNEEIDYIMKTVKFLKESGYRCQWNI